ncbi:MAG: transcriptional regulator NrdR [Roseofilum sp. SBFL]|uniref:transcriptional regulator NrdR n=1 Tax=unclassified Roseofilum TaxID=2620099 RepID=UPI001B0FD0DA|nr:MULTISPECIES: transcriptional regulator NrdR [unclassified Roseofilum]MBP0013312.1 transcriptional regulator NrdR [Roseofilum sp. SID3]MBP0023831.1 transcriptional regulator NrdR [Roseofilum sp. SID2]MBP0039925.1 transcriptional regulator NrdR [Roseofilum sp. SID1]MBP0043400.1 transcriptional regulator NrdR [Roseofilum sp. SBFL]
MRCPLCQHTDSRVLESRSAEAGQSVRRRRECLNCKGRFTTYERIEWVAITVLKRGGQREAFDRSKLLRGVVRSCEKTGIDLPTLEQLVDRIEMDLQQGGKRDVTSSELGQQVLHHLRPLSEVAYIRFASVYGKFQGIRDFMETLNHLQAHPIGGEDIPLCDRQENDARCSAPEAKMTTDTDQWVCPPSTVEAIGLRSS